MKQEDATKAGRIAEAVRRCAPLADEAIHTTALRELDALVAEEVMCWRWFECVSIAILVPPNLQANWMGHPALYKPLNTPHGHKREHIDGEFFSGSKNGGVYTPALPLYSANLFDAWDVVRRMRVYKQTMRDRWEQWDRAFYHADLINLPAHQAASAICRAALCVVADLPVSLLQHPPFPN